MHIYSPNGMYCINDGIKGLGCTQLGCPPVVGSEYICTSSGDCAEIIYKYVNCTSNSSICDAGMTCDTGTGACVKTEIITELKQCNAASDCYVPCPSMATTCNMGYCEYSGACEPVYITINGTQIIINNTYIGCNEVGCDTAAGFVCNTTRNVCERTIEKWVMPNEYLIAIIIFLLVAFLLVLYRFWR